MKCIAWLSFSLIPLLSFAQTPDLPVHIIPEPVSVVRQSGVFILPAVITIAVLQDSNVLRVQKFLQARLSRIPGASVRASSDPATSTISLTLLPKEEPTLGKEGYRLEVSEKKVGISANTAAGLYYGMQSFFQLLPKEIESASLPSGIVWQAPCVTIADHPRFGWRGLMFDVSRHFFTKDEVKRFIDDMVKYKFNLLHWHLTDDEGWRIEIRALPNLTRTGAWNVKKTGYFGTFSPPLADEPRDYGGFYTQDEIREVVQYAKERFVNILPEVDVPGHSLAAVASYPELSCTPGAENYKVRSGEQIMDWSKGAPPIALLDNTLCPANEKVYEFLNTVIAEVSSLFPFEYLHLGGDEAPHNYWQKTPAVLALMKKENLKSMEEVQSYFTRRVEKMVQANGKKLIGWDEILEGGVNETTAIMSWRGIKNGVEASQTKHEVVMSPSTYAYLDYMQADQVIEPRVYASLRLSKTYEFDPAPAGANVKYIKGGQANLWAEQIYNLRTAQYMLWPRALSISESLWSPAGKKSWKGFLSKTESHFQRLDAAETKYSRAVYDPVFTIARNGDAVQVALDKEVADLDIYYTVDNSFPDRYSQKYTGPIVMPKDAAMLRVITYRGNTVMGRLNTMTVEEMKKRLPKK